MKLMRNLAAGVVAGAVGTGVMDLLLYTRYRREGGTDSLWRWEFADSVTNWDQASAPGQLGYMALRAVTDKRPPDEWARPTTNLMHWVTGVGWGVQYGAVASMVGGHALLRAVALGPAAWLSGYVLLPVAKVYKPIWEYDGRTLAKDLSAHLVYGATAAGTFAVLARRHA
jgi:hypothetical protein